jgi:GTPase SAR1 family protein
LSFTPAFGLNDNPFRPTRALPGVRNRNALRDLDRKPLRLHEEPALQPLFVPEAGQFAAHLEDFRRKLSLAGYSPAAEAAPLTSFAFLIIGKQGTGKSTLVNAMLQWLLECDVQPPWVPFIHPPEELAPGEESGDLGAYLPAQIKDRSTQDDYCYVVIDDLSQADAPRALRLWGEVTRDRTLILFLVTSEERLFFEVTENSRVATTAYRTQPLTPDNAVELVRRRIAQFRAPQYDSLLQALPLFPFDEADIRAAVESQTERGEVITLRTFNVALQRVFDQRLVELGDAVARGFDLAQVAPEQLPQHVLALSERYRALVA